MLTEYISPAMPRVPQKYVPKSLSNKDAARIRAGLLKSRRLYRKRKFYHRGKVKSYTSKKSGWIKKLKELYVMDRKPLTLKNIARVTKCKVAGLKQIIRNGKGAYYSSGSRPNQTAFSWGKARLYSALAGGPAARTDLHILKKYCHPISKSLKLANKMKGTASKKTRKLIKI